MIEGIFAGNTALIERALDIRMQRQQLLSSDVANIDTPGFRALDVDFKESLGRFMRAEEAAKVRGDEIVIADQNALMEEEQGRSLKVVGVDGLLIGPDSNSANLELLMGKLQENAMMYRVGTEIMSARFRALNNTIDTIAKS